MKHIIEFNCDDHFDVEQLHVKIQANDMYFMLKDLNEFLFLNSEKLTTNRIKKHFEYLQDEYNIKLDILS